MMYKGRQLTQGTLVKDRQGFIYHVDLSDDKGVELTELCGDSFYWLPRNYPVMDYVSKLEIAVLELKGML